MARPVQVEDAIEAYFEDLRKQRAPPEVGLLIGKPLVGSRSLVLAAVASPPDPDGAAPLRVAGGGGGGSAAASAKGGKKGGGGGAGGSAAVSVSLADEWVAEHARQVARLLPGGLAVLGLYLYMPEAAWAPGAGPVCRALAAIAEDENASGSGGSDGSARSLVVLHADATVRKTTARGCACAPAPTPSALRVVELRGGSAAGSLALLRTRAAVGGTAPPALLGAGGAGGSGGGGGSSKAAAAKQRRRQRLLEVAEAVVAAEAARLERGAAAINGVLPPHEPGTAGAGAGTVTAIGDLLPSGVGGLDDGNAAAAEVTLLCAPAAVAAADIAPPSQLAASAAPRGAPAPQLAGAAALSGGVAGLAVVHRRDPAARALAELRADVAAGLRARLELLVEDALAADEEAAANDGNEEGSSVAAAGAPPAHPLLAEVGGGDGRAAAAGRVALALPRRVLLWWRPRAGLPLLPVVDYLAEGEAPGDAAARVEELLGGGGDGSGSGGAVDPASAVELEAPANVAAAKGGSAAAAAAAAAPGKARGSVVAAAQGGSAGRDAACSSTTVAVLAAGAVAALAAAVGYMGLASGGGA